MKSLLQLIHDYHSGVKNAGEEILKRMEPLIKSYASRIHCMERDDATQELYLTLLNCKLCLNGMPVPLLRNCYSIFNGTKYR